MYQCPCHIHAPPSLPKSASPHQPNLHQVIHSCQELGIGRKSTVHLITRFGYKPLSKLPLEHQYGTPVIGGVGRKDGVGVVDIGSSGREGKDGVQGGLASGDFSHLADGENTQHSLHL